MVAEYPKILISVQEFFFSLKTISIFFHHIDRRVFPELLAIAQIDILKLLIVIILQGCQITILGTHKIIHRISYSLMLVGENNKLVMSVIKLIYQPAAFFALFNIRYQPIQRGKYIFLVRGGGKF